MVLFLLCKFVLASNSIILGGKTNQKIIFTFWEPHENIPGYLLLCIKTWKIYFPEYDIIILDYKSIKKYIDDELFSEIICKQMPLPIQADAIRVALLKKYGGIWMDVDTIITNRQFIRGLDKYELVMIGDKLTKSQHIGFIFAQANSTILSEWLNKIVINIKYFRKMKSMSNKLLTNISFNYLGNGIIDPIVRNITNKTFFRLDKYEINALPELKFFENSSLNNIQKYKLFYFEKREPKTILNKTKGIILLHNSWTPLNYKKLSENEFLKQDILLAKLLSSILYKKNNVNV